MSNKGVKTRFPGFLLLLLMVFLGSTPGNCLDAEDIIRLKQAGLDGPTIQVVMDEKIVETCAFTVNDIVALKEAGLGDHTLQQILKSASFIKDAQPIEYAKDIRRIKSITVKDIIELKENDISDEVIQTIITSIKDEDVDAQKRSWDMLESMGVVVDDR